MAGIRLVIARSFERIDRQNADNLGLFTSTDFGLTDRIRRGEPIGIAELLAGRDAMAAEELRGRAAAPRPRAPAPAPARPCPPGRWRAADADGEDPGPPRPRRARRDGRCRARAGPGRPPRLSLHPRHLHGDGALHAARHLRQGPRPNGSRQHSHLRGPLLLRPSQPRATSPAAPARARSGWPARRLWRPGRLPARWSPCRHCRPGRLPPRQRLRAADRWTDG